MIRVVVTVALAVAMLAASLPAIEYAATERSDAQVRAAIQDVDAAATDLARSEEAAPGTDGARRVVTVRLPRRGATTATVERVVVTPANRTYRYRVAGRDRRTVHGTVPVYPARGEPLELRAPGEHRLVLRLVEVEGDRRVVIERGEAGERGTPADEQSSTR